MEELTATAVMLRAIPFFAALDEGTLESIAPLFRLENLRRGQTLAGQGFQHLERLERNVWFVHSGVVAAYTVTRRNTRKILFFLGPGKLLGHSVLGTKPTALYGEAMTDAILLAIPKAEFTRLLARCPSLTAALLAHYETDLWRMSHQLKNTADYLSVERKLAIKLLKLCREFGVSTEQGTLISFPLTVTQVAEFVGVPRETASRACKKLSEQGLIRYENRRFLLLDRERLAQWHRETE